MLRPASSTALIFFSRSAEQEGIAKPWLGNGNKHNNAAIARLLIEKAKANVQQSGLDVFHFDERLQRGEDFGARLSNAFADVFAMGYASAVAVGNDSPELGTLDWAALQASLNAGKAVIGPTLRGGAYLIGLQANAFDAAAFAALPWQTRNVYAHLSAYLQGTHAQAPVELSCMRDMNTVYDLRALARTDKPLFEKLHKLLCSPLSQIFLQDSQQPQQPGIERQNLRGPPLTTH
jgi:glycosyltransferase A (GT-A) superfamily protein (DUF2064 family)